MAHVAAIEEFDGMLEGSSSSCEVFDLGTGRGFTVRELMSSFEKVLNSRIPQKSAKPRVRLGDVAGPFASRAKAGRTFSDMLKYERESN